MFDHSATADIHQNEYSRADVDSDDNYHSHPLLGRTVIIKRSLLTQAFIRQHGTRVIYVKFIVDGVVLTRSASRVRLLLPGVPIPYTFSMDDIECIDDISFDEEKYITPYLSLDPERA